MKLIIDGKEQDIIKKYKLLDNKKDIFQIKLKGITNVMDMNEMFSNCESLLSLPNIHRWNTSNVIYMHDMFSGCKSLKSFRYFKMGNKKCYFNGSYAQYMFIIKIFA